MKVPDPSAACLPTGGGCAEEGERVVTPERSVVETAAEESKKRLGALSQHCWEEGGGVEGGGEEGGGEEGGEGERGEDSSKGGRTLFQ